MRDAASSKVIEDRRGATVTTQVRGESVTVAVQEHRQGNAAHGPLTTNATAYIEAGAPISDCPF
jgi:hypothetical protein